MVPINDGTVLVTLADGGGEPDDAGSGRRILVSVDPLPGPDRGVANCTIPVRLLGCYFTLGLRQPERNPLLLGEPDYAMWMRVLARRPVFLRGPGGDGVDQWSRALVGLRAPPWVPLLGAAAALVGLIREWGALDHLRTTEIPFANWLADRMHQGVRVNVPFVREQIDSDAPKRSDRLLRALLDRTERIVGTPFGLCRPRAALSLGGPAGTIRFDDPDLLRLGGPLAPAIAPSPGCGLWEFEYPALEGLVALGVLDRLDEGAATRRARHGMPAIRELPDPYALMVWAVLRGKRGWPNPAAMQGDPGFGRLRSLARTVAHCVLEGMTSAQIRRLAIVIGADADLARRLERSAREKVFPGIDELRNRMLPPLIYRNGCVEIERGLRLLVSRPGRATGRKVADMMADMFRGISALIVRRATLRADAALRPLGSGVVLPRPDSLLVDIPADEAGRAAAEAACTTAMQEAFSQSFPGFTPPVGCRPWGRDSKAWEPSPMLAVEEDGDA